MTQTKKAALLWSVTGALFALMVFLVVFGGLSGNVLVTDPEGIRDASDTILDCVKTGSWATLETMVSGSSTLSPAAGAAESTERLIWEAYQESLQWTCAQTFSLQGSHVTQKITVACLDIPAVAGALAKDPAVLAAAPEDRSRSLHTAAQELLNAGLPPVQREITLTFLREKGQWLLVPNKALQALLSGFTVS